MATKLFKSITIGEDTFKLEDNLGVSFGTSTKKNIPTANTEIQGATTTLTEAGAYLIIARWRYNAATSTGAKSMALIIRPKMKGESSFGNSYVENLIVQQGEHGAQMEGACTIYLLESQVPAQIAVFGKSNKTQDSSGYTAIYCMKLIRTEPT